MILYDVKLDKIGSNTAFRVEKNPLSWGGEQSNTNSFYHLLQSTNDPQISSEMMSQIFAPNSDLYINTQISNALTKLKDTNGKQVDFNALNSKQQNFVLSFLTHAFDAYDTYGTMAKLDDIQIQPNGQNFYIQANIHTIDGQVFSSAAQFSPKTANYTEKYDNALFGNFADFDRDYKISFSKAGILSTSERMALLNEIENATPQQLDEFDGEVEIAFYAASSLLNSALINNDRQAYSGVSLYEVSNIKLNLTKASETLKTLPKDEQKENSNQSLLDVFWDKFKSELYFSIIQFKQKQKVKTLSNSQNPKINNDKSLQSLLQGVASDENGFKNF